MFNNQQNRRPGNPVAGIVIPILIYWGISFLVDVIVLAAYMAAHTQDLIQAYESQSAFQTFMQETLMFVLNHSTEITSASALLSLPFFIYMIRKDGQYRKMMIPESENTGRIPSWKYLFFLLILFSEDPVFMIKAIKAVCQLINISTKPVRCQFFIYLIHHRCKSGGFKHQCTF